jgi:hypothetical protein
MIRNQKETASGWIRFMRCCQQIICSFYVYQNKKSISDTSA